jgi:addiction module RelE/StbE family toxin
MRIEIDPKAKKQIARLDQKLKTRLFERLELFVVEPRNIQLRNHALKGNYIGYRSISITGDYRLVFKQKSNDHIYIIELGTHSLYSYK